MKIKTILPFLILVNTLFAQTDLQKLQHDIVHFTYDYLDPASDLSVNIAQMHWTNDAKVNARWKISFEAIGNYMIIGNDNKTLLLDNNNFEILHIASGFQTAETPTILGGYSTQQLTGDVDLLGNGTTSTLVFYTPDGMSSKSIFSYSLQADLGLGYNTELKLRYVPKTKIDEVINKGYGFGLEHNFSRWFKALTAKNIDLSALVSYAKFNISNDIVFTIPGEQINRAVADGSTMSYELLASKSYEKLSFSLGLAYLTNTYTPSFEGTDSFLLQILNDGLAENTKTNTSFNYNFLTSYNYANFDIYAAYSHSNFSNITFGIKYNLNNKKSKTSDNKLER